MHLNLMRSIEIAQKAMLARKRTVAKLMRKKASKTFCIKLSKFITNKEISETFSMIVRKTIFIVFFQYLTKKTTIQLFQHFHFKRNRRGNVELQFDTKK